MERKNFAGWLLVSLLPLLAFIWMALAQHHASIVRAPVALSAELARTVSYGFVDQPIDEALGDDLSSGVLGQLPQCCLLVWKIQAEFVEDRFKEGLDSPVVVCWHPSKFT